MASSFCRITGIARNLPKPTYFPLLPPISPADAKKLCKITGRSNDYHNYSPIVAFAKPVKFDGTEGCKITTREDLNYVIPIFEKTKQNERGYEDLIELMTKMKSKPKKKVDVNKQYVYNVNEYKMGIIVKPEMEEGIRTGEFENINMSKDKKHINIKIYQGRVVKLDVKILSLEEMKSNDNFYQGEGASKKVLEKQQNVVNERNTKKQDTMARKKIFEDKEKKAEEEERLATLRPVPKRPLVKFDPKKRAEKLAKMEQMMREQKENKTIVLPKVDLTSQINIDEQLRYEKMLEDIASAQVSSISFVCYGGGDGFDWKEAEQASTAGFDWGSFPHEDWIDPAEVAGTIVTEVNLITTSDIATLEVVVTIETIQPVSGPTKDILKAVSKLSDESELKSVENVSGVLKSLKCQDKMASLADISKVAEGINSANAGYLINKDGNVEFVCKDQYVPKDGEEALTGAMIKINENEEKFVTGLVIKDSFIAGQTVNIGKVKKFVAGQTAVNKNGELEFLPGHYTENNDGNMTFVSGQTMETETGLKFVAGQMMDKGDGKKAFVPGQTILTDGGPKFAPGEIQKYLYGEEEFVPGIAMGTTSGDKFVPGQTFQTEEGLSFKPGQIVHTVEGPSFVPGKTFTTPEGDTKFVKGDMVQSEDGKVKFEKRDIKVPSRRDEPIIPRSDLRPLAVAGRNVAGFIVHPTNTTNIKSGETIYGDMVETKEAVQFYLSGKLPAEIPTDGKVISGELIVEDNQQRFIPGKMLSSDDGEKFVPGQLVRTNHGEEFVPGQIVETSEGPKFVPGQLVMTIEGEKFVPGQVIVETDGPKFVPGQIIQTKNGATFIPGQMMFTDEGQKFIPGQLVETSNGPRFVPGQVIETNEGPKFVPGTVVETEDGLKYVPEEAAEYGDDIEISFQGYDISPEELRLITYHPADTRPHSLVIGDQGLIDSHTLKKLAEDRIVIHGRTPSPQLDKKKKKKKKPRVKIDADEEEDAIVDIPDDGTEKIELLKRLIKCSTTVSNVKKERHIMKIMQILGEKENESTVGVEINAISYIMGPHKDNNNSMQCFFSNNEAVINTILSRVDDLDDVTRNDEAKKQLRNAIQGVITRRCDKEINDLIERLSADADNLLSDTKTLILLTEAVGVVCVTGDVEVATMLEKFISDPSNPNTLKEDEDVLSVLRQLIVLHQMAEKDIHIADALLQLQNDPEGVKDRRRIRKMLKMADVLLKKPKEEGGKFDIRHVASSRDIPTEIFEQIRADKEEADWFMNNLPDELFKTIMKDNRCGTGFLESLDSAKAGIAQQDLDKFKKGMAVVVVKENVQAVIPRNYARSVYYGIMPYVLIDEKGFSFFERGLTGRKLAPQRVIENTWYKDDAYYQPYFGQRITKPGMEYCFVMLGSNTPIGGEQYTWLAPSTGPNRLNYDTSTMNGGDLVGSGGGLYDYSSRSMSRERSVIPYTRRALTTSVLDHHQSIDGPSSYGTYSDSGHTSTYRSHSIIDTNGDSSYVSNECKPTKLESVSDDILTESVDTTSDTYTSKIHEPYVPLLPYVEEEGMPPIQRSETVGKLLDKYANFSVNRDFYHKPSSVYTKYLDESKYTPMEKANLTDEHEYIPFKPRKVVELTEPDYLEKEYVPFRPKKRLPLEDKMFDQPEYESEYVPIKPKLVLPIEENGGNDDPVYIPSKPKKVQPSVLPPLTIKSVVVTGEKGKKGSRFLRLRQERRAALQASIASDNAMVIKETDEENQLSSLSRITSQQKSDSSVTDFMSDLQPMTKYTPKRPLMSRMVVGDNIVDSSTYRYNAGESVTSNTSNQGYVDDRQQNYVSKRYNQEEFQPNYDSNIKYKTGSSQLNSLDNVRNGRGESEMNGSNIYKYDKGISSQSRYGGSEIESQYGRTEFQSNDPGSLKYGRVDAQLNDNSDTSRSFRKNRYIRKPAEDEDEEDFFDRPGNYCSPKPRPHQNETNPYDTSRKGRSFSNHYSSGGNSDEYQRYPPNPYLQPGIGQYNSTTPGYQEEQGGYVQRKGRYDTGHDDGHNMSEYSVTENRPYQSQRGTYGKKMTSEQSMKGNVTESNISSFECDERPSFNTRRHATPSSVNYIDGEDRPLLNTRRHVTPSIVNYIDGEDRPLLNTRRHATPSSVNYIDGEDRPLLNTRRHVTPSIVSYTDGEDRLSLNTRRHVTPSNISYIDDEDKSLNIKRNLTPSRFSNLDEEDKIRNTTRRQNTPSDEDRQPLYNSSRRLLTTSSINNEDNSSSMQSTQRHLTPTRLNYKETTPGRRHVTPSRKTNLDKERTPSSRRGLTPIGRSHLDEDDEIELKGFIEPHMTPKMEERRIASRIANKYIKDYGSDEE